MFDARSPGAFGLLLRARGALSRQKTFRVTPGPAARTGRSLEWWELVGMEILNDRVAGIDNGKASLTVSVRVPGTRRGTRHQEMQTFKTTTGSLRVMRDWLLEAGVSIAAIELTSTYWKPPFYCLEEVMEVSLLNAAHMKLSRAAKPTSVTPSGSPNFSNTDC